MALQYIKVENGIWLEYDSDEKSSRVVEKALINQEIDFLREQRDSLPDPMTDTEYLSWARTNYPQSGDQTSRALLTNKIDELQALKAKLV